MKAKKFKLDWEDDDDDYTEGEETLEQPDVDEEDGQEEILPTALGPEPVFTGLYMPSGRPIFRHPITVRMGFQQSGREYHCPTLEGHTVDRIIGWVHDT